MEYISQIGLVDVCPWIYDSYTIIGNKQSTVILMTWVNQKKMN